MTEHVIEKAVLSVFCLKERGFVHCCFLTCRSSEWATVKQLGLGAVSLTASFKMLMTERGFRILIAIDTSFCSTLVTINAEKELESIKCVY